MDDPKKKQQAPAVAPLTPAEMMQWNNYIDFMQKQGMKGNPALDDRNTNLGAFYFNKFKSMTPGVSLTYQDVPRVQSSLQNYRTNLVNQWKAGKMVPDESVKTEADLMPGLSQIDGWLGSKTSSYKFPVAVATNADGQQQNYGVDVAAYDKARGLK